MAEKGIVSEILRQKLSAGKASSERKEAPEVKRTSIALPLSLYRRLKACAAIEGRKMNDLMVELLAEGLEKRLKGGDLFKDLA
jgi:hypothetical protein